MIESVVIAGGGIAGWCAAAVLSRALPKCRIDLIDPPNAAPAPADLLIESTAPSVTEFHAGLGIDEAELMRATSATFKLGTRLRDWHAVGDDYLHAYGEHGQSFAGAAFHHHWLKFRARNQAASIERYSAAASAVDQGRFAHPTGRSLPPFSYALHVDAAAYISFLRRYAEARGVTRHVRAIADMSVRADRIDTLAFEGGGSLTADLFIDCTGPAARLIGQALNTPFEDWSHWLPCDRVVLADAIPRSDPAPLTEAVATIAGWRWHLPLASRSGIGHVYSSAHIGDDRAASMLGKRAALRSLAFRSGRRAQQWRGNCLALGDAAITLDPLEANPLHLIHSALQRMIAMLPGRDFQPVELAEYNRLAAREAEGVRDFLLLHYRATAREDSAFWRDCRALSLPDTLRRKIDQFGSRGRIVLEDEETYGKDSWLAVMLGQGIVPRRRDPLADGVDEAAALAMLRRMEANVRDGVAAMPAHALYLAVVKTAGERAR